MSEKLSSTLPAAVLHVVLPALMSYTYTKSRAAAAELKASFRGLSRFVVELNSGIMCSPDSWVNYFFSARITGSLP